MLHLIPPERARSSLTFCHATARSFGDWLAALPLANVRETSRRLYHAINELNRLESAPQQRIALLELIRPPIHYACDQLAQAYLGHSSALPAKQRQVANVAQALQLRLAAGYKQALTDLANSGSSEKHQRMAAQCAHRAIAALSSTVLCSAQLYCSSPAGSWVESHRLFRFAQVRQLTGLSIGNGNCAPTAGTTVAEVYKHLLLLGCCQPNQLRQAELNQVYELLGACARHTHLSVDRAGDSLFVINPERDSPPLYRSLVRGPIARGFFGFDPAGLSQKLAEALDQQCPRGNSGRLEFPSPVAETLVAHLSRVLGGPTERSRERLANSAQLNVCLGMSAAHYYSADSTEFSQFLAPNTQPPPPSSPDSRTGTGPDGHEPEPAYPTYRVPVTNTSPGGCCLHWRQAVPALQTGEILAVREQESQPWSLALIRWIRHSHRQGSRIGIELLAPDFVPCGVRLIQDQGNSSVYLRGILLPEPGGADPSPSLLVPRLPFQAGDRVILLQGGREEECRLGRHLVATGSVSQFGLEFAARAEPEPEIICSGNSPGAGEDFDALWPAL